LFSPSSALEKRGDKQGDYKYRERKNASLYMTLSLCNELKYFTKISTICVNISLFYLLLFLEKYSLEIGLP